MAFENEISPNTASDPANGVTGNHQGRLAHLPDDLLPKEIVGPIFEQAQESSLVLRMGQQIPVGYGETVIPVNTKRPEVGQVGVGTANSDREGYAKPTSGVAWGSRSFSPIKLATIVTVSEEFARANVNGLYSQIQSDLAYAIGRGIDAAVFHGIEPVSGDALQGIDTNNVLANTSNTVTFGDSPVEDLLAGYDMAAVGTDAEFNGWAADPRYRAQLARAMVQRDVNGNVADPATLNLATQQSSLLGFPVQFGRAVGGDLGAASDSGMRLVGGDFSQLRYGYADQVRVKVSDTATIDNVSMWQTNQIALLIEVTFGWVVGNLDAFVRFDESAS